MKPKILAIIGPTGCGKSELAIKLAQDFNGEIISADSRQFYRGMDIGTAKVSQEEREMVPHHMIDILDPNEEFNLFLYQQQVYKLIDELIAKGKLPIIVGGTGLYVSSIIENYIVGENRVGEPKYDYILIQPRYDRAELYKKINQRVKEMIENGLIEEVRQLKDQYGWDIKTMTGIGYREFHQFFETDKPKDDQERLRRVAEKIKKHSRNYAKRQITWFKRYTGKIFDHSDYEQTKSKVKDFLK